MSETIRISSFLHSTGHKYTDKGWNHYMNILIIIKNKLFNPDMPECNFVELVVSEQWDKAYWAADTRNREAFGINLFQDFIKYVKESPEYIQYNRSKNLNKILDPACGSGEKADNQLTPDINNK